MTPGKPPIPQPPMLPGEIAEKALDVVRILEIYTPERRRQILSMVLAALEIYTVAQSSIDE